MRWLLRLSFILIWLITAASVFARSSTTLHIVVLDESDRPMQIRVTAWDVEGTRQLATGVTDADGVLLILDLAADRIRLTFTGHSSAGMPIRNEATGGMLVFLRPPTTSLFLRLMDMGSVQPDPSEIALEGAGETALPASAAPALAPLPTVMTAPALEPSPPQVSALTGIAFAPATSAVEAEPVMAAPSPLVIGVLATLLMAIGGVLFMRGRL